MRTSNSVSGLISHPSLESRVVHQPRPVSNAVLQRLPLIKRQESLRSLLRRTPPYRIILSCPRRSSTSSPISPSGPAATNGLPTNRSSCSTPSRSTSRATAALCRSARWRRHSNSYSLTLVPHAGRIIRNSRSGISRQTGYGNCRGLRSRAVALVLVELRRLGALRVAVEVAEEVDLRLRVGLPLRRSPHEIVDQNLWMDFLLDVERRRVHHQVRPVGIVLAAPDQLRVKVTVAPLVGEADRRALVVRKNRLKLRRG